jgi:hypothetical protein
LEKFPRSHNLEIGCLVNFFYEGDDEMSAEVSNEDFLRIHYHDTTQATTASKKEGQ